MAATRARLRTVESSTDPGEIHAALSSAADAIAASGSSEHQEVRSMMASLVARVQSDDGGLRQLNELRLSRILRRQIQRLWDLMVAESERLGANAGEEIAPGQATKRGFRGLYTRLAKALHDSGDGAFDEAEVLEMAEQDWRKDNERYAANSHINQLAQGLRSRFLSESTRRAVGVAGLRAILQQGAGGEPQQSSVGGESSAR